MAATSCSRSAAAGISTLADASGSNGVGSLTTTSTDLNVMGGVASLPNSAWMRFCLSAGVMDSGKAFVASGDGVNPSTRFVTAGGASSDP